MEFEFVAQDDAPDNGTLHFRFGHTAGDVFLDNIRIVEMASGKDVSPSVRFRERAGLVLPPMDLLAARRGQHRRAR